jgi:hypothetical protein
MKPVQSLIKLLSILGQDTQTHKQTYLPISQPSMHHTTPAVTYIYTNTHTYTVQDYIHQHAYLYSSRLYTPTRILIQFKTILPPECQIPEAHTPIPTKAVRPRSGNRMPTDRGPLVMQNGSGTVGMYDGSGKMGPLLRNFKLYVHFRAFDWRCGKVMISLFGDIC